MLKKVNISKVDQSQQDEINFCSSQTFSDRLSSIQTLREQYIYLFNKKEEYDESRKRLRRVYRIIKSE